MSTSTNRGRGNSHQPESLPMGKIRGYLNIAESSLATLMQNPTEDINPRIMAELQYIKHAVDGIRSFALPLCDACLENPVQKRSDYCEDCHAERAEFAAEQAFERSAAIHPKAR